MGGALVLPYEVLDFVARYHGEGRVSTTLAADYCYNRAVTSGIVRGSAASRLTGLFYEARFSSHPLGPEQRGAARQALDDLAAELTAHAEPVP